jgi:hypothetical protein
MGGPTVDEILKSPHYGADGQEKKELPTFERYYQRLAAKKAAANNPLQAKDEDLFGPARKSNPQDERGMHEDSDLPGGLRESADTLNKLFDPGISDSPFAQVPTHSRFSDTFSLGTHALSKEQTLEHQKFMDEYRAVVDPSWHPPTIATPGNPFAGVADTAPPAWKPTAGLPSSPSLAQHKGLEAQADVVNPLLGPASLPDVNARALGQSRPAPALPAVEQPRVTPVPPPFTAPTRSFH